MCMVEVVVVLVRSSHELIYLSILCAYCYQAVGLFLLFFSIVIRHVADGPPR